MGLTKYQVTERPINGVNVLRMTKTVVQPHSVAFVPDEQLVKYQKIAGYRLEVDEILNKPIKISS